MMKLAVRVVKALPCVLKTLAVPALETSARFEGTSSPSNPCPLKPPPLMRVVVGAPVMRKTPSGFPSRSVTATVTLRPSAAAAETACAMTVCTSVVERLPAGTGGLGGGGGGGARRGGGEAACAAGCLSLGGAGGGGGGGCCGRGAAGGPGGAGAGPPGGAPQTKNP